jgi:DNA-binding FrmR family transcriptional regulator
MDKEMKGASHHGQLAALRRIEGQVRGVQRMISERKYCVDVLNAIAAARGALRKVEAVILKEHLEACVRQAVFGGSRGDKDRKLREIYGLFRSLRR